MKWVRSIPFVGTGSSAICGLLLFLLRWVSHPLDQQVEERDLPLDELAASGLEVEPFGSVHLGKLLHPPRTRRPLELEGVAVDIGDVEVALDGPRGNELPVRLAHLAEEHPALLRWLRSELLEELPPRDSLGILALLVLALRDRPRAVVLARPERSAHVRAEHLEPAVRRQPVHQHASAPLGGHYRPARTLRLIP